MSDLVGNPEDRFSHVAAHIVCTDNTPYISPQQLCDKGRQVMINLSMLIGVPAFNYYLMYLKTGGC